MDSVGAVIDHSNRVHVSTVSMSTTKVAICGRSNVNIFNFVFHGFPSYAYFEAFTVSRTG